MGDELVRNSNTAKKINPRKTVRIMSIMEKTKIRKRNKSSERIDISKNATAKERNNLIQKVKNFGAAEQSAPLCRLPAEVLVIIAASLPLCS
ncbi:MAG: hypothetical protein MMC33_008719 [Icmadophila ericetorum]|nr:hypothetical protein [Icmadophila ericetorum]